MKKLIKVSEAAAMLNLSVQTVYTYMKSGKLKGIRLGNRTWRTTKEDVEDFINEGGDVCN